jgi:hypothetical protein
MYGIVILTETMTGGAKTATDPYVIVHQDEEMVGALKIEQLYRVFSQGNPPQPETDQEPELPRIEAFLDWLTTHLGYQCVTMPDYPLVWSENDKLFIPNPEGWKA